MGNFLQFLIIVKSEQVDFSVRIIGQHLCQIQIMSETISPIADSLRAIAIFSESGKIVFHAVDGTSDGCGTVFLAVCLRENGEKTSAGAYGVPVAQFADP